MTPAEVTSNLIALMPRRERATLRKGQRVLITVSGVTASGTIIAGYTTTTSCGAAAIVELDGTGQRVDVPADLMQNEGAEQ